MNQKNRLFTQTILAYLPVDQVVATDAPVLFFFVTVSIKGTSIYSWIDILSPESPIAALLSDAIEPLLLVLCLQALSALLLKILNLNRLNPELIEVPLK